MPKKQTPSGSREKERPPWQAAVFRGGGSGCFGIAVGRGYLQSGRVREVGKFTVLFLPGHGPRLGWTAVAGGGPGEVSELVTWFGEFS